MRLWFLFFLLLGFYGNDFRMASGQEVQHPQPLGVYGVQPMVYQFGWVAQPVVPPVIYQPQIQYVPYQYQGTSVYRKDYRTPLRDALFGRYRLNHYYAPMSPLYQQGQ